MNTKANKNRCLFISFKDSIYSITNIMEGSILKQ